MLGKNPHNSFRAGRHVRSLKSKKRKPCVKRLVGTMMKLTQEKTTLDHLNRL